MKYKSVQKNGEIWGKFSKIHIVSDCTALNC